MPRCPNCSDTMQEFRTLNPAELTAVQKILDTLKPKKESATAYHRCVAANCLRVQRMLNYNDGLNLPEEFRSPGTPG